MADTLTLHPNVKVNLGLHITGRRSNGYHTLETVFWPLHQLHDTLTITPAPTLLMPSLDVMGMRIEGSPDMNLVLRAWRLLKNEFPQLPSVIAKLHKRIPTGAGLGGGSSDAAHMLMGLNILFDLKLTNVTLRRLALTLGADVPFFIENRPMLARGIGDELTPLEIDLSAYRFELVTSTIHSNTRDAYAELKPEHWSGERNLSALLSRPLTEWPDQVRNDFEPSVFARFPELARRKQQLYQQGAIYASMSGSGSALFGIFTQ